ncbi:MAG: sulfite exporter TauE/SafE family protein [bacterium]|nr:sulfite exporter TauE/SafE family protein [bacterium]
MPRRQLGRRDQAAGDAEPLQPHVPFPVVGRGEIDVGRQRLDPVAADVDVPFAGVMIAVGVMMLRPKPRVVGTSVWLSRESVRRLLPRLIGLGAAVGLLSGLFGIGGGFLIVPGLMLAADMEVKEAIGASLVAVTAFGLSSASSYAWSGLVDWPVAMLLVAGGAAGAVAGTRAHGLLASKEGVLTRVFAVFVIAAGLYVSSRGLLILAAM